MRVVVLRIDQRQGALDAGFALPQQRNDRIVRPRQQPLRPLFVERRDQRLQPIDAGDKALRSKRGDSGASESCGTTEMRRAQPYSKPIGIMTPVEKAAAKA